MSKHAIPAVEKGVEMPRKVLDGRSLRQRPRPRFECPWESFLRGLKVGDSFVVSSYTGNFVKTKAKKLDIDLVWEHTPQGGRGFDVRFWIYGIEGDRRPIYAVVRTSEEVVVNQETRTEVVVPRESL